MEDFYAKKCGYKYFKIKDQGKIYKAYKFSYFYSNVGDAFVLQFPKWLPKNKRKRIPFSPISPNGPKWESPTLTICCPWQKDCRPQIKEIEKYLRKYGYIKVCIKIMRI